MDADRALRGAPRKGAEGLRDLVGLVVDPQQSRRGGKAERERGGDPWEWTGFGDEVSRGGVSRCQFSGGLTGKETRGNGL